MSALPKAVRAQIEKANKLAAEFQESLAVPTPPDENAPVQGDASGTPDGSAASGVATLPADNHEQKYKVLQGKYNAEVPRLQNTVRDQSEAIRQLREQLTATQSLLASLNDQRPSASAQGQQDTPPAASKLIKDEEVREFGADLIDVMRRVAREEHGTLIPEIDRRFAPVVQRVQQAAQVAEHVGVRQDQSDQQTVITMLSSAVPNWMELNQDLGFLEWLDQTDPYAGYPRGQLLKQAYRMHDGPRVVAFFTGYLNEHAAVTPKTPTPPAAAAPAAPQRKLEQLVAPGTPKTGAASTQDGSGKRVWTRAAISAFYNGGFKGTPEQRKAMEKDIFAAQVEGRVR
jgi:hypothetical protein